MGFDVLELLAVVTNAVLHLEGYRGGGEEQELPTSEGCVIRKDKRSVIQR